MTSQSTDEIEDQWLIMRAFMKCNTGEEKSIRFERMMLP